MTRPLPIIIVVVLALVACTKNQRTETIRASVIAVSSAGYAFNDWDVRHQMAMIDQQVAAKLTRDEAEKQRATYRKARDVVRFAIHQALTLLALAATENEKASADAALKAGAEVLEQIINFRKEHEGSP